MKEKMSVVVTGGSGLLGSALVHQLVAGGDVRVTVIDVDPSPARLEGLAGAVDYIEGDVASRQLLQNTIGRVKPDKIFHLAAYLGDSCEEDPVEGTRVNINGVQNLFETALENGVGQLVFSSSLGTYGYDVSEGEIFTDTTLQRPYSYYGVTKLYAETAGRWYKRKHGLDFRSVRFPAIVGPGVKAGGIVNYIASMIELSYRGLPCTVQLGEDTRVAVVHVEDAANSLAQLAAAPVENIRAVNYLVSGIAEPPTAGEMAQLIRRRIPAAQIDFQPRADWTDIIQRSGRPVDDSCARREWNWTAHYDTFGKILDSCVAALESG